MKRILSTCVAILFMLSSMACVGAEELPVKATDGYISINCTVDVEKATPVLVSIISAIRMENSEKTDITETKIQEIDTHSELVTFLSKADYVATVNSSADGKVIHSCKTENLPTDKCYVVLSYLDKSGERVTRIGGSFDNVGKSDIEALLLQFNTGNDYKTYISADNNTESGGKKILEKSGAKMSLYTGFGTDVSDFTSLLYTLKGNTDFTLTALVNAFNEAVAYKSLWKSTDTLSVLNLYNKEASKPEKTSYWEIDLSEDSDFASLTPEEKTRVLAAVKSAKYQTSTTLAQGFKDAVALSLFRSVTTREELTALISADGTYGAYFAEARDVVANADLDELGMSTLYTNVLENGANASCESKGAVKTLFENSIPTSGGSDEEGSSDNSSSVTSTGGFRGGSSGGSSGKN